MSSESDVQSNLAFILLNNYTSRMVVHSSRQCWSLIDHCSPDTYSCRIWLWCVILFPRYCGLGVNVAILSFVVLNLSREVFPLFLLTAFLGWQPRKIDYVWVGEKYFCGKSHVPDITTAQTVDLGFDDVCSRAYRTLSARLDVFELTSHIGPLSWSILGDVSQRLWYHDIYCWLCICFQVSTDSVCLNSKTGIDSTNKSRS